MRDLLPVGTYVLVTERGEDACPPYYAIVRGHDLHRTKYELGRRYGGWGTWLFAKGSTWAFPGECRKVTKAEATAIPEARP